jgi:hypothetical protein
MMVSMDEPVVALDFDGVLNAFANVLPADFVRHTLAVEFNVWPRARMANWANAAGAYQRDC